MLVLFIRSCIVLTAAVFLMRVMGKRQVAQFQPYELVLAMLMADLAAAPMDDVGVPLLYGIVPMIALIFMHTALTLLCMKSEKFRRFIDGQSFSIIRDGKLQIKALDKLGFSVNDLVEALRSEGYANVEDLQEVVVETSGKFSAFPKSRCTPVTRGDMKIEADFAGVPLPLILSGQLQVQNLRTLNVNETWLEKNLKDMGHDDRKGISLCSLDKSGKLVVFRESAESEPQILMTRIG